MRPRSGESVRCAELAEHTEHCLTAARTGGFMRCGCSRFLFGLEAGIEDEPQPFEGGFAPCVEEAAVADAMEAWRCPKSGQSTFS